MEKLKYPRTFHATDSEKSTSDDKKHVDDSHHKGEEVVGTIKMDGENSSIYNDYYHARSLDSQLDGEDRRWLDAFRQYRISGRLPQNHRICGENLFYRHTCKYDNLDSLFLAFSVWNSDTCLSWDDSVAIWDNLGVKTAPVFYRGVYDKVKIQKAFNEYVANSKDDVEGFVIRNAKSFKYDEFPYNVSKFVREEFIIGGEHWRHAKKIKNNIKSGNIWDF